MSSCICGSVRNRCKTEILSDEASYVWTITDFDFHEAKGTQLSSPEFSSITNDEIKWNLILFPNGETNADGCIGVYLSLNKHSVYEKNKKIYAKFSFSFLNNEREVHKKAFNVKEFCLPYPKNAWGSLKFFEKNASFRNKILLNNALTIRCDVKFSYMNDASITEDSHQCDCYIEVPECSLSENLASLFEDSELTDVVLTVNGKDYPAHKIILAARSPVFRAMFKHNTRENELNRIDIEDLNDIVVDEMLKYIYTGKCANLEKMAGELLAAADKYDLYQLKMMCARTLLEGLSVENAASVLVLADMHGVKKLRNKVINFIVSKPTEVMGTEGWKRIRSNFELVDEVCLAVARRLEAKTAD